MQFTPHQSSNAIVRVAFVCEFAQALGDEDLRQLHRDRADFGSGFPKATLHELPAISLFPGMAQPAVVQQVASVSFEAYARDGSVEQAFYIQPGLAMFVHHRYTRWDEVWAPARTLLTGTLQRFAAASVAAFGLEYLDQFSAPADTGLPDVSGVLNRDSQYLVPRIFAIPGLWHSHHGSLIDDHPTPSPHSKNANINLDLVREHAPIDRFVLRILLRHRRVLAQPATAAPAISDLDEYMSDMHEADKKVLRDVLTDDAAKRIGLDESRD